MGNGDETPKQQAKKIRSLYRFKLPGGGIRPGIVLLILGVLLAGLCICSIPGRWGFAEAYSVIFKKLLGQIPDWWNEAGRFVFLTELTDEEVISKSLTLYYLPRVAGAVLVGASLAAAGGVYQGIFQNPLVSPDLLGASAGAAFGGALAIFMAWGGIQSILVAFAFGMLAVMIVYMISLASGIARENQTLTLLLAGVMVSSLFHAGINMLKAFVPDDNTLPSLTFWLMGAISPGFGLRHLSYIVIPVLIGLLMLFILRWKINLLTVGEDEAKSMGVNPVLVRGLAILAATLVTSASVAVCGTIGWVGLVIPHFVRKLIGSDYRVLLPASMIVGGMAVLLLDNLARLSNPVMPLGVYTGLVGVPFYLVLLLGGRRQL